jgi:hypothetical protein
MTNQTPYCAFLDLLFGAAMGVGLFPAANFLIAHTTLNGNQVFALLLVFAFAIGRARKKLMRTILNH